MFSIQNTAELLLVLLNVRGYFYVGPEMRKTLFLLTFFSGSSHLVRAQKKRFNYCRRVVFPIILAFLCFFFSEKKGKRE